MKRYTPSERGLFTRVNLMISCHHAVLGLGLQGLILLNAMKHEESPGAETSTH